MATKVRLAQQMAEVRYELDMRRRVYSGRAGGMSDSEKQLHLAQMQAVLETLLWLQENEANIRKGLALLKEAENAAQKATTD